MTTHQHRYPANTPRSQVAACKPFKAHLNGFIADTAPKLLPKLSSATLTRCPFSAIKQTTCPAVAREAKAVTAVPSSGFAEGHVRPAEGLRAVVIGTGMAGLAAARIMADDFDEVS